MTWLKYHDWILEESERMRRQYEIDGYAYPPEPRLSDFAAKLCLHFQKLGFATADGIYLADNASCFEWTYKDKERTIVRLFLEEDVGNGSWMITTDNGPAVHSQYKWEL